MHITTKILTLAVAGLLVTGCATATPTGDAGAGKAAAAKSSIDAATVKKAIANAKAAQKKAASVEGEWRDVGKFIKQAEKALKAGKLEKALKLANKAREQSELGYIQALEQRKTADMSLYIP